MKRILSFLCALSVVATMFVGLATTASATETIKIGMRYNGYTLVNWDGVDYPAAKIEAIVELPGTLTKFSTNRTTNKRNGRGATFMSAKLVADDNALMFQDDQPTPANTYVSVTVNNDLKVVTYAYSVSAEANYNLENTFSFGDAYIEVNDPSMPLEFTFADTDNVATIVSAVESVYTNEEYDDNSEVILGTYDENGTFTEGTTLTVESYEDYLNPPAASEYTLTTDVAGAIDLDVTVDGEAWDGSSKITEGAEVTVTAALTTNNVAAKIASVKVGGTDTGIGANGGTYTFEMNADTAIVAVEGLVDVADVKTINIHYTDDETKTTYFFGKANTAAAEFGIELEGYTLSDKATIANKGPKFPAINGASDLGYYGIGIIGLEAGTYNVKAYSDAVYGTVYSATVAE